MNKNIYLYLPSFSPLFLLIKQYQPTKTYVRMTGGGEAVCVSYKFSFPVNTKVNIAFCFSTTLYRFIPVLPGREIRYNNGIVLVSAPIMDQHWTGCCRFHTISRYRHMTALFITFGVSCKVREACHTHTHDKRMLKLTLCWNWIVSNSTLNITDLIRILIHGTVQYCTCNGLKWLHRVYAGFVLDVYLMTIQKRYCSEPSFYNWHQAVQLCIKFSLCIKKTGPIRYYSIPVIRYPIS